jgi:hypothetical protein
MPRAVLLLRCGNRRAGRVLLVHLAENQMGQAGLVDAWK